MKEQLIKPAAKQEDTAMERIAQALELIAEKLGNIETRIEDLTYEIQSNGNEISQALVQLVEDTQNLVGIGEEEEEGSCGSSCGSQCGS